MSEVPALSTSSEYTYRPLELQSEIRLVALAPGTGNAPIDCHIIHARLHHHPYQALSYEWGKHDEADPEIFLNDCKIKVRANLHEALRQLRGDEEPTFLWIDALCINQSDVQERNHQVCLMGEIYKNADNVIVWLGEARDGSDFAMDMFDHKERLVRYIGELQPSKQDALLALCERSYWRRAWVVQEMYLAKNMSIHCGDRSTSGESFATALATINGFEKYEFCKKIVYSPANRHRITKYDTSRTLHTLSRWLLLSIISEFCCTEPRDTVYAMLGIAVDCQNGEIMPDYDKPLVDVYIETMEFCRPSIQSQSTYGNLKYGLAKKFNLILDEDLQGHIPQFSTPVTGKEASLPVTTPAPKKKSWRKKYKFWS